MLHQALAPYCLAADFGLRLQREMLDPWLDGWSVVMAAALCGRRERLRADPIEVKEGGVTSVAFGPGGTIAAGYYYRGIASGVVLLDGDPASWRAKAGQIANRNFTRGEWRQFFPDTPCRRTMSVPKTAGFRDGALVERGCPNLQ